jgi:hypothetical protein
MPEKYVLVSSFVELQTGGGAERWTLTGWDGDDKDPGYLDKPAATLEDAQRWAEEVIWNDSNWNTKVAGWDGRVPHLQHLEHQFTICSNDGAEPIQYNVDSGVSAAAKLGALADPNAVWQFPAAIGAVYIPVRNITYVKHDIFPVEQPL